MRLVVLMIPIALVGGYVVHSLSHRPPHPTRQHAPLPPIPPAPPAPPAPPVALVAPAPAPPPAIPLRHLVQIQVPFDREFAADVADGQVPVRGVASASLAATVEGALQLVSRRLAAGDSLDAATVAQLVTWSASMIADAAADFDGSIEIETADGERVVIRRQ